MNNDQKQSFAYTYSAGQQDEVKRIREKYAPQEIDKMEQLRRLDAGVTRKGTVAALIAGILGTLIMGGGMSCVMVGGNELFIPGILLGVIGIIGVALAYPLYNRIIEKERERIAPEILRLTDELMK